MERRRRDERGRKDDAARMFIGAVGGPRAQPTGDSAGESASVYAVTITGHIHESRRVSDWPIASSFVDVVKFPPFTSRIRWRRAAIAAAAADENAVWNIHFLLSLKYRGRAWPGVRYKSLHSLSLSPLSILTVVVRCKRLLPGATRTSKLCQVHKTYVHQFFHQHSAKLILN